MALAANYNEWKARVDKVLERVAGLSSDDLADQPYMDWYEDGLSPAVAARQVLEEEGFYNE